MKTKLQILAAFAMFLGISGMASAKDNSHIAAILGNENSFIKVSQITPVTTVSAPASTLIIDNNAKQMVDASDASLTVADVVDNTQGTMSYHHGSGGGDDGGIANKNIIIAGVGFVSLVGLFASTLSFGADELSANGIASPTVSSIPAIDIGYERGLSQHWGVGLRFSYQSVSASDNGSYVYDGSQGPNGNLGQTYTYTDKVSLTGLSFMATGAYHFSASDKVDPYLGLAFGYTSLSLSYSSSGDPNASTDGNATAPILSIGGISFGGDLGIRLFFTDNIGAWVDLGYWGYGGAIFNLGLAAKF